MCKINNGECSYITEEENENERYNDYRRTRLRTSIGSELNELENKYGARLYNHFIENLIKIETNTEVIRDANSVRLTEIGFLKSDNIFRELFYVD